MRPRIIPCLLLQNRNLVKTTKFKHPIYIGDPINTIRIFNEKEADEIIILDISRDRYERGPDIQLLEELASECFMPMAYGGGVRNFEDARNVFSCGIEKIIVNRMAVFNKEELTKIIEHYGSQAVVLSIDVNKTWYGKRKIYTNGGNKAVNIPLDKYIADLQNIGIGEIFINDIDKDGTMSGYNIPLLKEVSSNSLVPVIGCGGAGSIEDIENAFCEGNVSAACAGSFFIFQGPYKAVLITYPSSQEISQLMNKVKI